VKTVTVSEDAAGRWFVSLLCEDPTVMPLPATDSVVGVDAGLDHLLALSTGEKIANPRHERRDRARLAKAQRACSRKRKGSANRAKARLKIARIHARVADRRVAAGLAVSACGAGVRPQRSTPGGQSATKQEPLQREP
jgi:putative transposase